MYKMELRMLLRLIYEFHRTGQLVAILPPTFLENEEHCRAWLEVMNGQLLSCCVKNAKGQELFTGGQAMQTIQQAGVLDWNLHERPRPLRSSASDGAGAPVAPPPPADLALVPRRLIEVNQAMLNSWPRLYRRVYVLVDGRSSVQKIATMLSLFPQGLEQVQAALADLRTKGLIGIDGSV